MTVADASQKFSRADDSAAVVLGKLIRGEMPGGGEAESKEGSGPIEIVEMKCQRRPANRSRSEERRTVRWFSQ
jgi:hypothetical protein